MNPVLADKNEIINLVDQAIIDVDSMTEKSWNDKPQPSKWSKKELRGHLIDSASNNIQDEWVLYQNYQISRVIKNIPEEKLQNNGDTGKGKRELHTLSYFIEDDVVHLKYHINQITA